METIQLSPVAKPVELPEVFRFGIKSLFLLTFVCAAAVVIVDNFEIFGTVTLFLFSAGVSLFLLQKPEIPTRTFWLQSIWGIIMPLACLATDPFVFSETGEWDLFDDDPLAGSNYPQFHGVNPFSAACYIFMLWQMAMLVASWFLMPYQSKVGGWLSGNLIAGIIFSGGLGIFLLPLAAIASIMLIGLPGFTPLLTSTVFYSAMKRCWKIADSDGNQRKNYMVAALGFLTSAGLWMGVLLLWKMLN